VSYPFPQK
jgi:hypothetical protein